MKNTLIISNGPAQLLSQLSIVKQKKLDNNIVGVVRMVSKLERGTIQTSVFDSELWLLKAMDIPFLGYIDRPYQLWGENASKKMLGLLNFKSKIRQKVQAAVKGVDLEEINYILTSYRPANGDSILFSVFKNLKQVYYNPDGSIDFYNKKQTYKLPSVLRWLGISNDLNTNPNVYFLRELKPKVTYNIVSHEIEPIYYNKVLEEISSEVGFVEWLSKSSSENDETISILFMQPFNSESWEGVSLKSFYKEAIKNELQISNNRILIKFHPREEAGNKIAFRKEQETINGENVIFFDDSLFSNLPIELISHKLKVSRVITISSTAVYYFRFNKEIEQRLYSNDNFKDYEKDKVEQSAKFLATTVNYIACGNN